VSPVPRELDDPAEQAWSDSRRSRQPVKTFTDPVSLSKPLEAWNLSRTYIKATDDPSEPAESAFWTAARAAQASSDWSYHEIATHHLVPLSRPQELAGILLDVASG